MWESTFYDFLFIALELTILFIVISFLIQLLQGFIPYHKIEPVLMAKNPLLGAIIALLFAFITPFCSCSTIPLVVHMLNKKMRFAIVMVFLFASPVLDPTILTIMGVILGWNVVFIYIVAVSTISILIGFSLEYLGFEKAVKEVVISGEKKEAKGFDLKKAWGETWQLMRSVYPFLVLGAVIGAVIHGVVPTEWIASYMGGEEWWLIPLAAIIGIPLYIRLSTMIPISQILIVKGMAYGPVMAMMISSAGASLPEITMLHSIFEKKLVIAFIFSVITMATISGTIFFFV